MRLISALSCQLTARRHFFYDIALKTPALHANPVINVIHKTPGNPVFRLFHIDAGEAAAFRFSDGQKMPRTAGGASPTLPA
jgi:uncharacterized pyridoxamine 5'-phosphate oxidase family protein